MAKCNQLTSVLPFKGSRLELQECVQQLSSSSMVQTVYQNIAHLTFPYFHHKLHIDITS